MAFNKDFLPHSIGKILEFRNIESKFLGRTENADFEIVPYSQNIIRISTSLLGAVDYHSYAVIKDAETNSSFEVEEGSDKYVLKGKKFDVLIQKNPFAISFLHKDGSVISSDHLHNSQTSIGYELYNYRKMFDDERFVGLGEKTGNLDRRNSSFINENSDAFDYQEESDPLYSTIPFYMGLHSDKYLYGIFLDNASSTRFNFGVSNPESMFFSASNGQLDYYFIYGDSVTEIIQHYSELTGKMQMPPLWALGFHQSRYSYYPDNQMEEVIKGFENRGIPLDAVHFDIHYMQDYKAFTWNEERFPNHQNTIKELKNRGVQTVTILDPGIKKEAGYSPYDDGIKNDYFVKYPEGKLYEGGVWPGTCHFPDFTNSQVREWWAKLCQSYIEDGVEGLWNDMNEPAVWGQKFPEYIVFNNENRPTSFKGVRNAYGLLMSRATAESFDKADAHRRKFVLTRSAYAGIQRYSAKWTGDNTASDSHMLLGVRLINSLSLCGVSFSGMDVGGFIRETDNELFARWMGVGCFTPFFRAHKMINTRNAEPWSFGEEILQIAKNYIQLRYRLIPYLYKQFYLAASQALPVNKSLVVNYPFDEKIFEECYQNQYLFGEDFLICPVESKKEFAKVYLPKGNRWYDFYTDKIYEGGQELVVPLEKVSLPVFVKAGSIIPMQKSCKNLTKDLSDELYLHIYPDGDRNIESFYYEDDGTTHNWSEKGEFLSQKISYQPENKTFKIEDIHNQFTSRMKKVQVVLHGKTQSFLNYTKNKISKEIALHSETFTILEPIPNFDPFIAEEIGRKAVNVWVGNLE